MCLPSASYILPVSAALPSSVITLPYNIAVNGTGLPSVLLTTNETYQVPAVSISPSFPRASSLTYNWTVLNVSPVGTHTPSISNASAASPLLTNITPGSSVSLQVLVTDPAIVPSFSGSRKSFNTTLAFPAFTTPLMMTGIAPPLSLPSLLSPANTNTCVSGRVCAFTYRVSGVNFTGAGNSSTSFYLLSTPPGPNTVSVAHALPSPLSALSLCYTLCR